MPVYIATKVEKDCQNPFEYAPKAFIDKCPWASYPTAPTAYARVCYTDNALLVEMTCMEANPKITYFEPNEPVYEDSCLEFFINPLPGQNTFCDFECNASGALLLGHYNDGEFSLLNAATRPDFGIKVAQHENFWRVSYTVPASFLEQIFPGFRFADRKEIHVNFYKCGDKTDCPHYSCWSPIRSEEISFFHSEDFGTLIRV